MTEGKDSANRPNRVGRTKQSLAFDQWLDRGLHELFDGVAKEPIPEELLKIIEDDKS
ncbi:hypothetical protein [Lichenicoccus roseus]|uniref:hypothetical protein n=1 Tax=Lichenicoccus roseus TaxID=2683649 RepID=UPI00148728AB|nr:hypothetical protein [Lichenicoccus roseus]